MAVTAARRAVRAASPQRVRQAPDLAALVERYRREHLAHKKPSTRVRAEGLIKRLIVPALGKMKAEAGTPADGLALPRGPRETRGGGQRPVTPPPGLSSPA